MTATTRQQFFLKQRPAATPSSADVPVRETALPTLQEGQFLIKNQYFSIDPAIRGWMSEEPSYMPPIELDAAIRSTVMGTVVETRHPDYAVGDKVYGITGWETYSVSDGWFMNKIPTDNRFPDHYYISLMGAVGLTAYFGVTRASQPGTADTVLISGAAGAVGSLAGQIAKANGATVVGIAGGTDKCRWLTEQLGFDAAIDYKQVADMTAAISEYCPNGVDLYFDNVGGEILDAALMNMAPSSKIIFCGAISNYNKSGPVPGPYNWWQILARSITVQGYLVSDYLDEFADGAVAVGKLVESGAIQFREEIVDGFENTLTAFLTLFDGSNKGKLVIKLHD
jgi:NADPH-dependent curcumin reductase CurA